MLDRRYKWVVKLIVLGKKRRKNQYILNHFMIELITVNTVTQPWYHKLNSLSRPQCLLNDLFINGSDRHEKKWSIETFLKAKNVFEHHVFWPIIPWRCKEREIWETGWTIEESCCYIFLENPRADTGGNWLQFCHHHKEYRQRRLWTNHTAILRIINEQWPG